MILDHTCLRQNDEGWRFPWPVKVLRCHRSCDLDRTLVKTTAEYLTCNASTVNRQLCKPIADSLSLCCALCFYSLRHSSLRDLVSLSFTHIQLLTSIYPPVLTGITCEHNSAISNMKHFGVLFGLAAIAAAAPYPTAPFYPIPTAALPPPPGSGIAAPTGLSHPSGGFPGFPNCTHPLNSPLPSGHGNHPPQSFGTAPPQPPTGTALAKRAAQFSGFSFPSMSMPTVGFGGESGIAAPTGLGSGSDSEGSLASMSGISGIAAPTGGSGASPSFSIPTGSFGAGSASATGLSGLPQPTGSTVGSGEAPEPPFSTGTVGGNGTAGTGGAAVERGFGSLAVNTRLAEQQE
ncbi:uncharacterized protein MYCFIDRAFT_217025 [Pseudocercospora fijiensis CIRAD86]|uniref:Uncharacterized protein n=1 Tax=Pseudocercospora fijiensis (strain CIRAD86) TaxID=383855 RepID=M2ZDU0_PSEFD|nr:uncharacterized protein MYCFIDRAFT_217025 [Pseudocercospora fijiensis CIRAD86]EME77249.1 hypothetical protein MYCFIDRAFT_217025 [Pseudocercospora fijiensis CIRAD86]